MAVKLKVNKDLCIGCGSCVAVLPDAFTFDDNGKAECIKEVDNPDDAIQNCPVKAIEL